MDGIYLMRQYNTVDKDKYFALLEISEMGQCPLEYWNNYILPNGFFIVEHIETGNIVGACFASHQSRERHPFGGNLGWLAVDPNHRGNKIGVLLVNAVVDRLQSAGYNRIYLETHDFRLPALKIYLDTGWVPFFYNEEMVDRWEAIYQKLRLEFKPSQFPEVSAY
jgi:mycothiol synthase